MKFQYLSAIIGGMLLSSTAYADCAAVGLSVDHAKLRETPPSSTVSAGYMVVHNHGDTMQRLIAVSAPFAKRAELHNVTHDDGVMKMFEIDGGVQIPAGGKVIFKSGKQHLMFMELHQPLKQGEQYQLELTFEGCGVLRQDFGVYKMSRTHKNGHKHDHDHNHKNGHKDH